MYIYDMHTCINDMKADGGDMRRGRDPNGGGRGTREGTGENQSAMMCRCDSVPAEHTVLYITVLVSLSCQLDISYSHLREKASDFSLISEGLPRLDCPLVMHRAYAGPTQVCTRVLELKGEGQSWGRQGILTAFSVELHKVLISNEVIHSVLDGI